MPTFDVYLARTYRVRIEAPDAALAERLAEEFVGDGGDVSTDRDRAENLFRIRSIETVDNSSFDAIELESP
jgi:hypothetical protein